MQDLFWGGGGVGGQGASGFFCVCLDALAFVCVHISVLPERTHTKGMSALQVFNTAFLLV